MFLANDDYEESSGCECKIMSEKLTFSLPIRLKVFSSGVPRMFKIMFNWST